MFFLLSLFVECSKSLLQTEHKTANDELRCPLAWGDHPVSRAECLNGPQREAKCLGLSRSKGALRTPY